MKCVKKDQHILHVLKNSNCKLKKAILKNCDDRVVRVLAEILHNVLRGNVKVDAKLKNKLKKYKNPLLKLHKEISRNTSVKYRRKKFTNQTGGFWPLLLEAALSGVLSYGGEKLIQKITS